MKKEFHDFTGKMRYSLFYRFRDTTGWRGDLDFPSREEREKWFAQYHTFVEHYARLATSIHADLFAVGVELPGLAKYEAEWRLLIARVRKIYPGPLVYAATAGPEFESITFWDALDYIGLDNYYPLPDDLSANGVLQKVEAVHRKFGRPVIFTEAGFTSSETAHRQIWNEMPGKISHEHQARCYEAVFRTFYHKPWFQGVYWWKVGTNGFGGVHDGSHTPWGKPAMDVVARWYLKGGRRLLMNLAYAGRHRRGETIFHSTLRDTPADSAPMPVLVFHSFFAAALRKYLTISVPIY